MDKSDIESKQAKFNDEKLVQNIIDKYFQDNPLGLVKHHLDSYNDFFFGGLERILNEKNPIRIMKQQDPNTNEYKLRCNLYLGGRDGKKIYYGKPIIYDETNTHYMYPNEARLRDMTYGMTIHYDIDIDFIDILDEGEQPTIIGEEDLDISEENEQEGGANQPKRKGKSKKKNLELTPGEFHDLKGLQKNQW